jgi:integrase
MARKRRGRRGNNEGSIYQTTDGRWRAAITLDDRGRKYLTGRTREDIVAKLRKSQQRIDQGLGFDTERLTVGAWLDHWLTNVVTPHGEPTTTEVYEVSVRLHIKPYVGKVQLGKLTPELVEKWLKKMEEEGKGARTRHFALQRLRTALNEAMARGHVVRNVASATLVKAPKQQSGKHAAPTPEDMRRLREAMEGERLEPLMAVALGAGLRRSEVLGLTWEALDMDGPTPSLTVAKRVNRVSRRLLVREGAKTEAGQRRIPLSPPVVAALHRRRAQALQDRLSKGPRWLGPDYANGIMTGFVFLSNVGTVLEPRNLYRVWERVRERAGLDQHTFHDLRHDFGSLLMERGVPDKVVAELMGHANPAVTRRVYQHASDEMQRRAVEELAQAMVVEDAEAV